MAKPKQIKDLKKAVVAAQKPKNAKGQFVKTKEKYSANTILQGYQPNTSSFVAPDPDPFDVANLPPGVAPSVSGFKHVLNFRGIANAGSKIYRNLDAALLASRANAKAMRNDLVITEPLFARELALAQLEWHLVPEDENDPQQKQVVNTLTKIIKKIPRFTELVRNLSESLFFGKMAVILNYEWKYKNGQRELNVVDWKPINGDKLCWRNNDLEFGYLVHLPTCVPGREIVYTDRGRAELFTPEDKEAVIVHKYMSVDAADDEPELAILVHGTGLRHWIYFTWYLKQELMGWLFDVMQRYGAGGIQIWRFQEGNESSENAVRTAAETQSQNNILLFPSPTGDDKQTTGLEIVSPDGVGLEYFYKFINDYFNNQIRRLIIGSSNTSDEHLGEGGSDIIKTDFVRLLKYDATLMEETLTNQLVKTLLKYNFPSVDYDIKFQINVDKPDVEQFLEAAQRFYEMNGALDENQIRAVIGLSDPGPDGKILQKSNSDESTIKSPPIGKMTGEEKIDTSMMNKNKDVGGLGDQLA